MANPFFLFENIYADGTLTVTSEASGYPKENLTDWRIWNYWKGTSTADQHIDVDYGSTIAPDTLVIAGHNGGTVSGYHRLLYSDDGSSYSTSYAYTAFADDYAVAVTFSESAHRYWRVDLGNSPSSAMYAGIVTLGRRLDLPRLDPSIAPYSGGVKVERARNEYGQFLGANVRYVTLTGLRLNYDSGMQVTDFFDPASGLGFDDDMVPHLKAGTPFWFAWNLDQEARHIWECTADDWDSPFVATINRRVLKMNLEAYVER